MGEEVINKAIWKYLLRTLYSLILTVLHCYLPSFVKPLYKNWYLIKFLLVLKTSTIESRVSGSSPIYVSERLISLIESLTLSTLNNPWIPLFFKGFPYKSKPLIPQFT